MAERDLQRGTAEERLTPRATIFALATGAPPTAIAIVRISGPDAFRTLTHLTRKPLPSPRQMTLRVLRDPVSDEIIDRAMVAVFPAPHSATGDDVVELHLHGGPAVVTAALEVLDRAGLIAAARGGFTRRAFDNGKLDLGQVEALGDLVAAETDGQRRAALVRTGGELAHSVDRWRETLTGVRADLEATLDFADEDGVGSGMTAAGRAALVELGQELATVRADGGRGAQLRDGVTVAIVGPVNAGKSTLLNAVARRDVAMVSPTPGTTRDVIEVRLALNGVLATLVDTAGWRRTDDPLEVEGISRGMARATAADILIALGPTEHADAIRVAAKSDLRSDGAGWRDGVLHLSAATGDGLATLEAELGTRISAIVRPSEPPLVAHRWQMAALDAAVAALGEALVADEVVLAAESLRMATAALASVIGSVANDDVLDEVFARFCIGK